MSEWMLDGAKLAWQLILFKNFPHFRGMIPGGMTLQPGILRIVARAGCTASCLINNVARRQRSSITVYAYFLPQTRIRYSRDVL
jgi:hypothetical protein